MSRSISNLNTQLRTRQDNGARRAFFIFTLLPALLILFVTGALFVRSWPIISEYGLSDLLFGEVWKPNNGQKELTWKLIKMKNDRAEYKAAVQHYLETAGLWEEVHKRLHDPATSLSIGQQQRLCLARGLAVEPEIILGDEPTSALDPISSQNIESRLLDLKQQYTTVIVTHTLRHAKRLADYVIYMYLGEVIEAGPASEVFTNPQHERTKQYLEGLF
jgi:ABC-type methionine transport system ATPase subunit